jgi:hypothetical protein
MLILQFFLRFACFFCLLGLVVFERHDHIGNQDDIRHERCKTTGVCCVACAKSVTKLWKYTAQLTPEYEVDGEEVGADGQDHHSEGETHQLPDDGAAQCEHWCSTKDGCRATHVGTAGDMFEGPGGPLGSFSRNVFSSPTVLLVVIVFVCGG